jgi:hypothetical protein
MKKKEIVRKLFEKGILLSPEMLEKASEESLEKLLSSGRPVVGAGNKVNIELPEKKEKLTVKDYADFYTAKYNGIKKMLLKKISPVSISNAGKNFEVSIIGIIREKTPSGFIAEDPTGQIEILTSKTLVPGDVAGIRGYVREGRIMEKEIIWPDIPLPKETERFNTTLILATKPVASSGQQIVYGKAHEAEGVICIPESPARLSINGIEIVVFEGEGQPKEWLKKRHLPDKILSGKDFCLIEKIPHVLWLIGKDSKAETYKGVTIVQTGRDSFAKINMFTRTAAFEKYNTVNYAQKTKTGHQ